MARRRKETEERLSAVEERAGHAEQRAGQAEQRAGIAEQRLKEVSAQLSAARNAFYAVDVKADNVGGTVEAVDARLSSKVNAVTAKVQAVDARLTEANL